MAKLSTFNYEESDSTAAPVSGRRDSVDILRNGKGTWENIAAVVQKEINETESKLQSPPAEPTTVTEATMRRKISYETNPIPNAQRRLALLRRAEHELPTG